MKKRMLLLTKRFTSIILMLALIISMCPPVDAVEGGELIDSGACGENATWTLTDDGVLTISGTGDMYDFYPEMDDDLWGTIEGAPWDDYAIKTVIISDGITSVGDSSFRYQKQINAVSIPDSVVSISEDSFSGCIRLKTVILPKGLMEIEDGAFDSCESLTEIVLPESLQEIGTFAFSYCSNLQSITFLGHAPELMGDSYYNVFMGVAADAFYPANDDSWTEDVRLKLGGDITWIPVEQGEEHSFTQWSVTVEASCFEKGEECRSCQICGIVETREISMGDHTVVIDPAVEATCTTDGLTEGSHCEVCGEIFVVQEPIPAEHLHVMLWDTFPTCTEPGECGETCGDCGKELSHGVYAPLGHSFKNGVCIRCDAEDESKADFELSVSNVESSGKIRLTWEKVSGVSKYKVYRSTSEDGEFKLLETLKKSKTKTTNTSAKAGTTYYYYVAAVAKNGTVIGESNIAMGVCKLKQPSVTTSNDEETGKIRLTWKSVNGAVGYEVYRANSKNGTYALLENVEDNEFIDMSAEAGRTYYYKVKALATVEMAHSDYSDVENHTSKLAAPVATVTIESSGKIRISWEEVDGAVKYEVYRANSKNGSYKRLSTTSNTTLLNSKNISAGKTYYYKVKAIAAKSVANSDYSAVQSITCKLESPTVTVGNTSSGKIQISWEKVKNAVSYNVYRADSEDGEFKLLQNTKKTSLTNGKNVTPGTTYYYQVVAVCSNKAGNSDPSEVQTGSSKLSGPTVTISSETSGGIYLSWKTVDGAKSYQVYRSVGKNGSYSMLETVTDTELTDTAVEAGKTYYYYVIADAENGMVSAKSNIVSQTCNLARPVVTVSNEEDSGKIRISWEAVEGAIEYEVYRATSRKSVYKRLTTTSDTTVLNSKNTTVGKTYYYKVYAIGSGGAESDASEIRSGICKLPRPEAELSESDKGKPVVSWEKISGASKYKVYIYDAEGELLKASTTKKTKLTHGSAEENENYSYQVMAVHSNSKANSALSELLEWNASKEEELPEWVNQVVETPGEAIEQLAGIAATYGFANAFTGLTEQSVSTFDGNSFYRLQQNYQGIPVYGRSVVYTTEGDGTVASITGNAQDIDGDIDLTPTVSVEQVSESIQDYLSDVLGYDNTEDITISDLTEDALCIYNMDDSSEACLAYRVYAGVYEFVVDADSAEVLMYSKTFVENTAIDPDDIAVRGWQNTDGRYILRDAERNIYIYDAGNQTYWNPQNGAHFPNVLTLVSGDDEVFGDADDNTATSGRAVDYLQNIAAIYDYYKINHQEEGIGVLVGVYDDAVAAYNGDNAGGGIVSARRWLGTLPPGYDSDKFEGAVGLITFGTEYSRNVSDHLDTLGHEYTHFITRKHASWSYSDTINQETGAIDEALSDIFGEIIEENVGDGMDWEHGDRVIRDPSVNAYPEYAGEKKVNTKGWMNVKDSSGNAYSTDYAHGYSTVISHAAYLMWNGIDGNESKKIDIDTLAKLWYRAMLMMPSDCDFSGCRHLVELAATSMKLTTAQIKCVGEAFDKVGITGAEQEKPSAMYDLAFDSTLSVYGGDEKLYDNYTLEITGNCTIYGPVLDLDKADSSYSQTVAVTEGKAYKLDLPQGVYTFKITDNANPSLTKQFTVCVWDDEGDSNLDIFTNFGGTPVKGTVSTTVMVDGVETNVPVENAVVTIYSHDKQSVCETISMAGRNGVFETTLPVGNYSASVEAEGYHGSTTSFEVTAEKAVYLSLSLSLDVEKEIFNALLKAGEIANIWYGVSDQYYDAEDVIFADYYGTGKDSPYNRITYPNVNSYQDLLNLTRQYYTETVVDFLSYDNYLEKDGKLYLPAPGNSGSEIDEISVKIKKNGDGGYTLNTTSVYTVDTLPHDYNEFNCTYENDHWLFDEVFLPCNAKTIVLDAGMVADDNYEALYDAFRKEIQNTEICFVHDDFDYDGTYEAFGTAGNGSNGDYTDVQVYYITSDGAISRVDNGLDLYGRNLDVLDTGTAKFFVWNKSGGGSGGCVYLFGVKNGSSYQPDVSGNFIEFKHSAESGIYEGLASDWSNGYHDYMTSYYTFDESTKEFVPYEQTDDTGYEMREKTFEYRTSGGVLFYRNKVIYPYFHGNSAGAKALNAHYQEILDKYSTYSGDIDAEYEDALEWDSEPLLPYYDDLTVEVTYDQKGYVSVLEVYTMWSGGMHPYNSEDAIIMRMDDAEELSYKDILEGTGAQRNKLVQHYIAELFGNDGYPFGEYHNNPYALTDEGLCFYLWTGDAVPPEELTIPYTQDDTCIISTEELLRKLGYTDESVDIGVYLSNNSFSISGKDLADMFPDLSHTWDIYNTYANEDWSLVISSYDDDAIFDVDWSIDAVNLYGLTVNSTYEEIKATLSENGFDFDEDSSRKTVKFFVSDKTRVIVGFNPRLYSVTDDSCTTWLEVKIIPD